MSPIYDALGVTVGVLQNMQPYDEKQRAYALRRRLRHQLRVRLRLPARQHGQGPRRKGPARALLRDRGRGRQHPDRRGAHAADHLRRPRTGGRPVRQVRAPGAADDRRQDARRHGPAHARSSSSADFDFEIDEKHKTVSITEQGVAKAERFLGIDHLYRAENGHLVNHLIQSLRAESLYKRDVDYAVIDGEVKIIDEFTGRILEGRRWSEGLHQAVEAKEGVRDPGGEPDARDDHLPELLPPLRQARRA